MKKLVLNLAWFYPDELSDNGDQGNLLALKRRAEHRGIELRISDLAQTERLKPGGYDIFYFGSGLSRLERIREDFFLTKLEALILELESSRACLALEAGLYLLGQGGPLTGGREFSGAAWLDLGLIRADSRASGPILIRTGLKEKNGLVVGFENHRAGLSLGPGIEPFGRVEFGVGNRDQARGEGVRFKSLIGTRLGGPVLTLNPHLADLVLALGLKTRDPDYEIENIENELDNRVFDEACLDFNRRSLK